MEYNVINGEISVCFFDISYVSESSVFMVGDTQEIHLANAFETPPEKVIVGVTLPIIE